MSGGLAVATVADWRDYRNEIEAFRAMYKQECFQSGIDYVQLDTSMQFDKALTEYLISRRHRG